MRLLLLAALAACTTSSADPAVVVTASSPVEAPRPAYVERSYADFRRVQLDPSVIGTTEKCDVARAPSPADGPLLVRCKGHGGRASLVEITASPEARATIVERAQLELRIDGVATGADARTTFVAVVGELRPPEPPSRCLCDRNRGERSVPEPPPGWSFAKYTADRETYWGTRQICVIASVGEIARSSPDAPEYGLGRVFDPEQLPYAARVHCTTGSIMVGARDTYGILNLAPGQAIEVELGWSSSAQTTGKLVGTRFRPERDLD